MRLLRLGASCVLNNYDIMVHHDPIYRKHPKDFNEKKNPIIF